MTAYGVHPMHDAAVHANQLRRDVRRLATDESINDRVGLSLAANLADALADALDRQWWAMRPEVDSDGDES